jgi:hypothetical protein
VRLNNVRARTPKGVNASANAKKNRRSDAQPLQRPPWT